MMEENKLMVFTNEEFGNIRTVEIDGEGWLVGKDVAEILGYSDTFGALKKHVDDEYKQNCQNDSFETPRGMTVINESGVYSLVLKSKMPKAKQFKRWVTSEVLPSIRRHGVYAVDQLLNDPDALIQILETLQKERQEKLALQDTIDEQKPLVDFANQVADAEGAISVGDFVKYLYDEKNINIGRNILFKWLRDKKILMKNNLPYQSFIKAGYFKMVETVNNKRVNGVTLITGKGQLYLTKKLSADFVA